MPRRTCELQEVIGRKIRGALFATLAGDHLRGIASDEDDAPRKVVGAMVLPLRDVIGLRPAQETKERHLVVAGGEVTLVFHDVRHYLDLVASSSNTAILEALFSPHVILTGSEHERLAQSARSFLNRQCEHDYRRRAGERRAALRGSPARAWDVVEAARLYLSAEHLLRTGEVECDVQRLATVAGAAWVNAFVRRHRKGGRAAEIDVAELRLVGEDLDALEARLEAAREASPLPEAVGSVGSLDEFLIELRLRELR